MSTYSDTKGNNFPIPHIDDNLVRYLETIAPISRYKELTTEAQMNNMHGQMKIVDHLIHLNKNPSEPIKE